jgi:anti-sigma B factor antagonist
MMQTVSGVAVVDFGGSTLLEGSAIEAAGRQICKLVDEQAHRKLVLDFSNIKLLSSNVLGMLVKVQKHIALIKGRIAICGLRPELKKIFTITRLDRTFDFYDNERQAVASFDPLSPA